MPVRARRPEPTRACRLTVGCPRSISNAADRFEKKDAEAWLDAARVP